MTRILRAGMEILCSFLIQLLLPTPDITLWLCQATWLAVLCISQLCSYLPTIPYSEITVLLLANVMFLHIRELSIILIAVYLCNCCLFLTTAI